MTLPSDDPDLDNLAREVNEDIEKGEGEKHFQDIFDELASVGGNCTIVDPNLRADLERFAASFQRGLAEQLSGNQRGLVCQRVSLDGFGRGFVCVFSDRQGRPFTVGVSYDDGFAEAAKRGKSEMGSGLLDLVLTRLIAAYDRYFERMA